MSSAMHAEVARLNLFLLKTGKILVTRHLISFVFILEIYRHGLVLMSEFRVFDECANVASRKPPYTYIFIYLPITSAVPLLHR